MLHPQYSSLVASDETPLDAQMKIKLTGEIEKTASSQFEREASPKYRSSRDHHSPLSSLAEKT